MHDLVRYVHLRRVAFEVCPTSNLQTMPELAAAGMGTHAARRMIAENIDVTINTDNRLVSSTDTVNELQIAVDAFELTPGQLRRIIKCGFMRSFFPGSHKEKQEYVRSVMAYYDSVAEKHGVAAPSHEFE